MSAEFQYDVFLSHNQADKPRVRRLVERLRTAGLRVWFDEWIVQPGDDPSPVGRERVAEGRVRDRELAIERGLEASRTLVLCLSPAALGSDWVGLERSTVLFRDPANAGRRFIPLLLADCKPQEMLRCYKYVDYRKETEKAFAELRQSLGTQKVESPTVSTRGLVVGEARDSKEQATSMTPQDPSEKPPEELRVAVDSTLLLSADSYLGCVLAPDPRAQQDFEFVVTIFCGCKNAYLRKPQARPKDSTPLLSLFWGDADTKPYVQPPPATTMTAPSDEELLPYFLALMHDHADELFDLAHHQLSDPRMDTIYWTGGNPKDRLVQVHSFLKDAGYFRHRTPLTKRLRKSALSLCGDSALLAPDLGGTIHYVLVYLFNLFAKGPPYAYRADGAVYYHPAWARRYALSGLPQKRVRFADLPPWGPILVELANSREWSKQIDRPFEKRFADGLWRLRAFTLATPFDPDAGKQAVLQYLFEGLNALGIIPPSYLGRFHQEQWTPESLKGCRIEGDIVASGNTPYARTRRELGKLAANIAAGWHPVIADYDSFRLDWEKPPHVPTEDIAI